MIYDEGRQLAVLHKKGSPCVLTDASDLNADMITDYSSMELEYQKLWKGFFESIAIDARICRNVSEKILWSFNSSSAWFLHIFF